MKKINKVNTLIFLIVSPFHEEFFKNNIIPMLLEDKDKHINFYGLKK